MLRSGSGWSTSIFRCLGGGGVWSFGFILGWDIDAVGLVNIGFEAESSHDSRIIDDTKYQRVSLPYFEHERY